MPAILTSFVVVDENDPQRRAGLYKDDAFVFREVLRDEQNHLDGELKDRASWVLLGPSEYEATKQLTYHETHDDDRFEMKRWRRKQ